MSRARSHRLGRMPTRPATVPVRLAVAFTLGCASGSAPWSHPTFAGLPAEASVAGRSAAIAVRSGGHIDRLWPGFWSPDRAFLLVTPGGGTVLVTTGTAPPEFRRLSFAGLLHPYPARVYWSADRPADLRGELDLHYPVGDVLATAVTTQPDVERTLELLYHEAFHTYQGSRFSKDRDTSEALPDSLAGDESLLETVLAERRALAAALARESPEAIRAAARSFLGFRSARFSRSHPWVLRVQRQLERYEGSAYLVGHQARLVALGRDSREAADTLRAELLGDAPAAPRWVGRFWIPLRWHAYASGAAMGLLLDRLGESDWRARLEVGADFDFLLARATGWRQPSLGGADNR